MRRPADRAGRRVERLGVAGIGRNDDRAVRGRRRMDRARADRLAPDLAAGRGVHGHDCAIARTQVQTVIHDGQVARRGVWRRGIPERLAVGQGHRVDDAGPVRDPGAVTDGERPLHGCGARERPALTAVLDPERVEEPVVAGCQDEIAGDRDVAADRARGRERPADDRVAHGTRDAEAGPRRVAAEAGPDVGRWLRPKEGGGTDPDRDRDREQEGDADEDERSPRHADGNLRLSTHLWLPQDGQPARQRPPPARRRDDLVEDVFGEATGGLVDHPVGHHPLERHLLAHADFAPITWSSGRSTARAVRSVASPRCSRDLAVPGGMSRISATSVSGRSR